MGSNPIKLKRAYEPAAADDHYRVLVDRLWPRGLNKQNAHLDLWLKDIAPSPDLRVWFDHDPKRWAVFRRRYIAELKQRTAEVRQLLDILANTPITLVYAAKDEAHTHALVLHAFLESARKTGRK